MGDIFLKVFSDIVFKITMTNTSKGIRDKRKYSQ